MSVRDRFWHASPTMLALHVVRTLFALALVDPFYRELMRLVANSPPARDSGLSPAELALESVARTANWSWPWALWWIGCYALLSPLLGLTWLQALAGADGLRSAVRSAAPRYPAALWMRALLLLALGTSAALGIGGIELLFCFAPPSASLETAARAALLLGLGLVAVRGLAAHDLTLARHATGSSILTALRFGLAESSTARALRLLASLLVAAVVALAAEALGRLQPAWPGERWPSALLAVQQTLLFCALAARGVWLAYATDRALARSEPGKGVRS